MSAADRSGSSAAAGSDVAAACREAGLVRLVGTADGDALAAVGVLSRALRATDVAFQASVASTPRLDSETDADATVTVGFEGNGDGTTVALADRTTSVPAYAAARELAPEAADPVLALAGVVASGAVPGSDDVGLLEDADLDRRAGVAVPVADLADGLAHSTLFHAPFSGDVESTRESLSEIDADRPEALDQAAHRRVASFLALTAVRGAPPRAAESIERALHPHVGGPFETLGGYADVLDAVARERPGTGVALALGHDAHDAALEAWRHHATTAHRALREADTGRYDGVLVVRADAGPAGTVARLVRDFRSPEPVVLCVADDEAAAAGDRDVGEPLRRACSVFDAETTVVGRGETARAALDSSVDVETLVTAFREAL